MRIFNIDLAEKEMYLIVNFEDLLMLAEEIEKAITSMQGNGFEHHKEEFPAHQMLHHYLEIMEVIKLRNRRLNNEHKSTR